jgi:hypothetical protein
VSPIVRWSVLAGAAWREPVHRRPRCGASVVLGRQRLFLSARDVQQVSVDHALRIALGLHPALVEPQRLVAEPEHEVERMRDEHHRAALPPHLAELVETLVREGFVADRQHFVDEQHVGIDVDGHGEAEPHVHAGRVRLDRRLDELLQPGERDDLVEPARDLALRQPEHHAVDVDVLASRDLGMKPGAQLDQRRHPAGDGNRSGGRLADARQELEHRALARAVAADDPERAPGVEIEADAVEGIEHLVGTQVLEQAAAQQRALQRPEVPPPAVAPVAFVDAAHLDRLHTCSASVSRSRSKTK